MKSFLLNGRAIRLEEMATTEPRSPEEKLTLQFLREWTSDSTTFEFFTSGTTGHPRAITFSRQQLIASAQRTINYFNIHPGAVVLDALSTRYIAGKMMLVRALVGNLALMVVDPVANPLKELPLAPAFTALVPHQIRTIFSEGYLKQYSEIDCVLVGGIGVPPELNRELEAIGNSVETFGMTETLTHVAVRRIRPFEPKGFELMPGVRGTADEVGCLRVEVDFLPEPVKTNDLVEFLSPQRFRWLGRKDFVINSGGHKISPETIEKLLGEKVVQPYFVGSMPDARFGAVLVLYIEGEMGEREQRELKERVNAGLTGLNKIRGIGMIEEFKRTTGGKILRQQSIEICKKLVT